MNRIATMGFAVLLAMPAIGCAQERKDGAAAPQARPERSRGLNQADDRHGAAQADPAPKGKNPRRLESVTWNSVKHELTWVISKGEKKEGNGFNATGQDKYEINMDDATMTFNGERRKFSKEEAVNVHMLMDLIAKYAIDSTIWWDQGQGQPVDGNEAPGRNEDKRVAILRVAGPARDLTTPEIDARVRDLERQLHDLKRLQKLAQATPLVPTSH